MNFLKINLKVLEKRFPGICDAIFKGVPETSEFLIEESRQGDITACYEGKYLHSRSNPAREAEKIIRQQQPGDLTVFAGFGLGYYPEAFLKQWPGKGAVIIEPDRALFLEALRHRDFTEMLSVETLSLFIGNSPDCIKYFFNKKGYLSFTYIPLLPLTEHNPDYFNTLKHNIDLFLSRKQINNNTLKKFGSRWVKNLSKNLPLWSRSPDISQLLNQYRGIPALILAAGPSLEEILPRIKDLKERMLILCVDTAVKALLDTGTEPDIIMSIDAQYWNSLHLFRAETKNTIFIAESSIPPLCLSYFPDRTFFLKSSFPLGSYFEKKTRSIPSVASGGSVSTTLWDFTRKLGVSFICFAGQDLGFPGNQTHYKNSYFERAMHIYSGKTMPLDTQSFNYMHAGYPAKRLSNSGGEVWSDRRMEVYIEWFEEKMKEHRETETFNLSYEGVKIEGMEFRDFQELLELPRIRPLINNITQSVLALPEENYSVKIREAAQSLVEDLSWIEELAQKACSISYKIDKMFTSGEDITKEMAKLDMIDKELLECHMRDTASFLLGPFFQDIHNITIKNPYKALKLSEELYHQLSKTTAMHILHIRRSIKKL